jgi:hypothetical protein
MSFPYKNPISPNQLIGQQSLERTKTYGTSYSTLSTGGFMEVYSLDQLYYTIPPSTYGPIEFSGNSIPITFSKGSGTTFSIDTLTLQPDNISSGRRKLGMLVYVYEENQIYQFLIDNYDTLWNSATGSTGTTIISDFGTTIKANSPENITFISGWTANTIEGVSGETSSTAVWKKLTFPFTGNTSASCVSNLYVDNIYGCSPINVNELLLVNSGVTSNGTYGLVSMNASNNPSMLVISGSGTIGGASYIDFIRVTNTAVGVTTPTKTIRLNNTGGIEFLNNAYSASILTLSDNGNLFVGGGNAATVTNNDGASNYLSFNLNNSQLYDDGNFHIHSRGAGQAMWLNSNNGSIIIGNQSPVLGGGAASSIIIGSGSTTTRAFVNVYGSKTYTIGSYGFLATIGAGTGAGTTAPYSLYCNNRVEATEFDATSDERLKDIQGEIQLDDAINLVNNIKPIKYTWKDSEDKGIKVGYSAQQVEKSGYKHLIGHIPNEDLTATTDSDGFTSPKGFQLTMNYDQVTPYHGVVIKHLLEEIEKLKQEIEILKNK